MSPLPRLIIKTFNTTVLFHNVHGFSPRKFNLIKQSINDNLYTFAIITETWHKHSFITPDDPFFLFHSNRPSIQRKIGHQNGGIAILCHPSIRHLFTLIEPGEFHIYFTFKNIRIACLYLPPRLQIDSINEILNLEPPPKLFIGDFNFRFRENNDSLNTLPTRASSIFNKANSWNLHWIKPSSALSSRTDHIFASSNLNATASVLPSNSIGYNSDHNILQLTFSTHSQITTDSGPERIFLSKLNSHPFNENYSNYFSNVIHRLRIYLPAKDLFNSLENIASSDSFGQNSRTSLALKLYTLTRAVLSSPFITPPAEFPHPLFDTPLTLRNTEPPLNTPNSENPLNLHITEPPLTLRNTDSCLDKPNFLHLIDNLHHGICKIIWHCSRHTLGSYKVHSASHPMTPRSILYSNTSTTNIMKLFKLSQKNQNKIAGVSPSSDPLIDAKTSFNNIYHSDSPTNLPIITNHHNLDTFFSPEDIAFKIKRYSARKSAGPDGIHVKLLQHLIDTPFITLLACLFNSCLLFGITPTQWNLVHTILIPKKDSISINNCRPISITHIFRRLFEALLLDHLNYTYSEIINLHPSQAGARKGFSTLSQILVSDEVTSKNRKYNVLLDISKAYDTIPHQKIINTLHSLQLPLAVIAPLGNLFTNRLQTRLCVNGRLSDPIPINRGILQGSVLSPLIFEMIINPLCERLNQHTNIPKGLFFIDDIKISTATEVAMHDALHLCSEFATENSLAFNASKSCALLDPNTPVSDPFLISNQPIPALNEANYLGIPTNATGSNWDEYLRRIMDKTGNFLKFLTIEGKQWTPGVKLAFTKTFLYGKLQYCLPIIFEWLKANPTRNRYWTSEFSKLDRKINNWIFNRNTLNAKSICSNLTKLPSIADWSSYLRSSINFHIQKLHPRNPWHTLLLIAPETSLLRLLSTPTPDFETWNQIPKNDNSPTFKTWWRKRFTKQLHDLPGTLHHYLIKGPTTRDWTPDRTLFIQEDLTRRDAIKWRTGSYFFSLTCPTCSSQLSKRHFLSCNLFELLTTETYEKIMELDTSNDTQKITNPHARTRYCLIDHLLNHNLWPLASTVFKEFRRIFRPDTTATTQQTQPDPPNQQS